MYPGPGKQPPGAGTQPVTPVINQYAFEMLTSTYPRPAKQLPGTGTQLAADQFAHEPNAMD